MIGRTGGDVHGVAAGVTEKILDAMQLLMTGEESFVDQTFQSRLLRCMEQINPGVLKKASVSTQSNHQHTYSRV